MSQSTAVQEALQKAEVQDPVLIMEDAESAVHFLDAQPPYQDRELPRLVLLDLSLPLMGGLEFLYWLRSHEDFAVSRVPVIVREENPELIAAAYESGANSVFARCKGTDLVEQLRVLDAFWKACEAPRSS